MTTTTSSPEMMGNDAAEQQREFLATPERVSQYLELRTDEVAAEMKSVEGRRNLYKQLMEHEESLRKDHKDFNPEELQKQLDLAGETLNANEKYLDDVQSPEKKGMFRRAWESIKSFPRKHPVVTTILVAAAAAGGLYLAWNYLGAMIIVPNVAEGAADVAETIAAPTGGAFEAIPSGDIVPPNMTPGPIPSPGVPLPPVEPGPFYSPGEPI